MIAAIQRSIVCVWAATLLVFGTWAAMAESMVPVIGLTLTLVGHAVVLAAEFVWMHAANRHDLAPRASMLQLARAWWDECWHAPRVFFWRQPWRAARWKDTEQAACPANPRGTGVLLIHGFFCNRGLWNQWMQRLLAQGTPVVAVTLEPAFGSIDDYKTTIEAAVSSLERTTGTAPVIVAHSMGGLALRRWWADTPANGARLRHAITIGTPHGGTRLAALALSRNGRQMRRDSCWLTTLRRSEPAGLARKMTCFYSHTDNIVFPASTATMPGADNRHLMATAHVAMVDHPAPWAELQRLLRT